MVGVRHKDMIEALKKERETAAEKKDFQRVALIDGKISEWEAYFKHMDKTRTALTDARDEEGLARDEINKYHRRSILPESSYSGDLREVAAKYALESLKKLEETGDEQFQIYGGSYSRSDMGVGPVVGMITGGAKRLGGYTKFFVPSYVIRGSGIEIPRKRVVKMSPPAPRFPESITPTRSIPRSVGPFSQRDLPLETINANRDLSRQVTGRTKIKLQDYGKDNAAFDRYLEGTKTLITSKEALDRLTSGQPVFGIKGPTGTWERFYTTKEMRAKTKTKRVKKKTRTMLERAMDFVRKG